MDDLKWRTLTDEKKLLHLAAQVGQIRGTIWAFGEQSSISFAASHMAGTICSLLNVVESRLIKLSKQVK